MQIIIINQQKRIPISKRATQATVLKTLKILNPVRNTISPTGRTRISNKVKAILSGQLTIVYVDNRTIQGLNSRFFGKCHPTDVLCFDVSFPERFAADIVISAQKAYENSQIFKTTPRWEMNLYLIHAILHLLGFKDHRKRDRVQMHRKALQILKQI